jgi:hypothetical protein
LDTFGETAGQVIGHWSGPKSLTKQADFIDFIDKRVGQVIGHPLDKVYSGSLNIFPPFIKGKDVYDYSLTIKMRRI